MLREQWKLARSILDRALELPLADRDAFVARECGENAELRREVESLLALESRVRLEPPSPSVLANAAMRATPRDATPRRIGPYELVEQIGAGGMGSVWRARRVEGFEQIVAIKLIKRGMDTDEVLRRFETERTVLATLQHDGIARLFDGGATESGVPYLVMEYVDGVPIDRFCATRGASVRAKIELVLAVCDAVQFAHEHLVVHRDLKPSNILVTAAGVPKLLDFGIAKVLSEEGADNTAERTLTGQRVLTPAYASPEQLRGEALTTKSDVFSLGLVLWELLVGRRAFDRERSPESEPTRASLALAATSGSRRDARRLAGDLDTILARACHADTTRRYGSVEAFAADLRRYLSDQPVRAQRDSLVYRVSKFTRRNKLVVGSFAVILLAFAAATAISLRMVWRTNEAREREREQGELARRRFDQTRKLATAFLIEVYDKIEKFPGAIEARQVLLATTLATLDQLASERSDDEDLEIDLFDAYVRLAAIHSDPSMGSLGQPEAALAALEKARSIAERFAEGSPARGRLLGIVEYEVGDVEFVRSDRPAAAAHFTRAIELLGGVPQDFHTVKSWEVLGSAYTRLAMIARYEGRVDESACWLDTVVAHHRSTPENSRNENDVYYAAVVLQERGCASEAAGDGDGAVAAKREALGLLEELVGRHPENGPCRTSAGQVAASLANTLVALERADEALVHAERAVDLQRELAYQDPDDSTAGRLLHFDLCSLGKVHLALGNFERAETVFDEAASLSTWREERAQDGGQPTWELCVALTLQGVAAASRERWPTSLELGSRAADAGDSSLRSGGAKMILSLASHRLEFAARSVAALEHATLPVEAATARDVLALAVRLAESARDELATLVPAAKDEETHRALADKSRLTLASIEELARRYEPPRD
jgi:eukaryotic-like serine/threonine-protein kinase